MRRRDTLRVAAAAAVLALTAGLAEAGSLTEASGPVTVNGNEVTVDPANPIAMKLGDVVDTGSSTATFTTNGGDKFNLEPGSTARADGEENGVDSLFLKWGAVFATLSGTSTLGVAASWVTTAEGEGTSEVYVEAPQGRSAGEALFRSIRGGVWLRYHSFNTWLPERHAVSLEVNSAEPQYFAFRTDQQNRGTVDLVKKLGGGEIIARIPRATSGTVEPVDPNKTKICNDVTSLKTGKIELETKFSGRKPKQAALGAGACALIDNLTGDIALVFEAVAFEILDRAISLTSEFSTLAQSNFADVD